MSGAGGPRARAIETAGRWFGPLAQRRPRPDKDKAFAEIRRAWHFVDAKGEILGRLAAKIAPLLCGKHKPIFQPARDVGDYVVVTNVEQIEVTGKSAQHKLYYRHSGYPGGLKALTYEQLFTKNPVEPLRKAINGMLPKNKLRPQRMCRSWSKAPRSVAHLATRRSRRPASSLRASSWGPRARDPAARLTKRDRELPVALQAPAAALPGRGASARGAAQPRQPRLRHAHAALAHGALLAHAGQGQASGDTLTARPVTLLPDPPPSPAACCAAWARAAVALALCITGCAMTPTRVRSATKPY
jgi:large subunit ribosomal protein L13